jgi:uncharacterized membrane protein YGL010W
VTTRPVDRWFEAYGESHRNTVNEILHFLCVPVISMCVLSFLSLVPWQMPGVPSLDLANLFAGVVLGYYLRLSWPLALALVPVFVLLFLGVDALRNWQEAGGPPAWQSTLGLFVVSWIGQFIGHAVEGRKPSFLQDLQFLLIGPLWLMGQVFQRAGWRY